MCLRRMGFSISPRQRGPADNSELCGLRRPIQGKRMRVEVRTSASVDRTVLARPYLGGEPDHLCDRLCADEYSDARTGCRTWIFGAAGSARAVGDRPHIDPRAIPLRTKKIPSTATFHASERT